MTTISIQATDTLFFRDGRPFSMGDDSFAQGVFPPPPGVVYGALRTAFLSEGLEADSHWDNLIGASESLSFRFMALQAGADQYFPMPMDLIVPKLTGGSKNLQAQPLVLKDKPAHSNTLTPKILRSTYDGKTEDDPKLLGLLALERYLRGETANINVRKRSDFMCIEPKIGIGRNRDSHVADDGKLFRIQANRLAADSSSGVHHLRFFLGFEGLEIPKEGWLALGGERRVAFYESNVSVEIPRPDIDSLRFKIYLSTPAVFAAGWKPEALMKEHGLTLLTAALDRPVHIGGWDLKERKPKPMLQCVPAGAVYYVQAESIAAAQAAAQGIHGKPISENLNQTDYCKQGFGIAYIGKISEQA